MIRSAFAIMLCLVTFLAKGEKVFIEGRAPEYANHHLIFQTLVNPISNEMGDLASMEVDENGHFKQEIEITGITFASLDMGRFRGHIFFEPGVTYQLVLPPFKPKTDAERFNPYFEPEEVVIGIANEEAQGLNRMIRRFDEQLAERFNNNAQRIFTTGDKQMALDIINELDSLFPADDNPWFAKYKRYAYGELKSVAYKRQKRLVMEEVFGSEPIDMSIPSFQKSFNTVFQSFFTSYFSSSQGKAVRDAYNTNGSFEALLKAMQEDPLFQNSEFAEIVLLKGLYDAYYSGRYNEAQIINLLKQAELTGKSPAARDLAQGLSKKVNWLRPGSEAPSFTLTSLDGKQRSLSDYKGKFIYLNFIHSQNHACKQDLQRLNVLAQQFKREMTLVTIVLDEDPSAMEAMVKDNKYNWDFLHYASQAKVVLDYNIKALPVYFVVDPEGNLKLSPSPSPGEDFAPIFIETLRQYKQEQLRRKRPTEKSIYDI